MAAHLLIHFDLLAISTASFKFFTRITDNTEAKISFFKSDRQRLQIQ